MTHLLPWSLPFLLTPLCSAQSASHAALSDAGARPAEGFGGGAGSAPTNDCLAPAERAAAQDLVAAYLARTGGLRVVAPEPYTFYPLAGRLYRDLYTQNFVDLDPTAGVLDWDCSDFSYDGHDASDVDLRTFGEQLVGVPVFAAQDGVVVATHDGEDDMHTSCAGIANSVIIDHGNGRIAYYWHLRRNSVRVSNGQAVLAGEEIGLAASSGCSTGPHLHFATYENGQLVEPYTGPCNPGTSAWTEQTPIERSLYVRDLNLTNIDIATQPGLPFDMPRRGTFVLGLRTVRFWTQLANLPANSTWRVLYLRPDGSTALNSGSGGFGNPFYRNSWWWWGYSVNLDTTGTWKLRLLLNGATAAEVPFDVVATAAEVVNRPPDPVTAGLWPARPEATDVLQCRLQADLLLDDPDYDLVRYRYLWRVDGAVVRDIVSAAHADTLARGIAPAGSLVSCEVTPGDGSLSAPTTRVATPIRPFSKARSSGAPSVGGSVELP